MTENKLVPAASLFTISYIWALYIMQHFTKSCTKSLDSKPLQLNALNDFILWDKCVCILSKYGIESFLLCRHFSPWETSQSWLPFFHCLFKSYFPSNLQINLFSRIRRLSRSRKGVIPFETLFLFSSTDLPVVHLSVLHFSFHPWTRICLVSRLE